MLVPTKFLEITQAHLGLQTDLAAIEHERKVYEPTVALSEANLCDWIASASVGQAIVYHEGLLLRDRSEISSDRSTKERARIHGAAFKAAVNKKK